MRPRSAATISPTSGATLPSSLYTGTTTESCGVEVTGFARSGMAQAHQYAIQHVQVAVMDHQLAAAGAAGLHVHARAQGFAEFAFQRGDVGGRRSLGRSRFWRARNAAGGHLLHAAFDFAHRPLLRRGLLAER